MHDTVQDMKIQSGFWMLQVFDSFISYEMHYQILTASDSSSMSIPWINL